MIRLLWRLLVVAAAVALLGRAFTVAAEAAKPTSGPLKVFILAGQSNMQGQGKVKLDPKHNDGKGSLEYLVKDPATSAKSATTCGSGTSTARAR
jgi:alpha-galactosidase